METFSDKTDDFHNIFLKELKHTGENIKVMIFWENFTDTLLDIEKQLQTNGIMKSRHFLLRVKNFIKLISDKIEEIHGKMLNGRYS